MSIEIPGPQDSSNQLYELPATSDVGTYKLEAREELGAQLEQDRAAIQAGIEEKLTQHGDMVQQHEDGSRELILQMPWQSNGSRRPQIATITLLQRADRAGNTQTDLTFSARKAWTSRARAVTVGGETRIQELTSDSQATRSCMSLAAKSRRPQYGARTSKQLNLRQLLSGDYSLV